MHILLTGGTGFIGKALCEELVRRGHSLTVVTRRASRIKRVMPDGVQLIPSVSSILPTVSIDAIVNLAGEPIADSRWTSARIRQLRDSRIGITEDIISYIARAKNKPQVLVSGSAVGYYGDQGTAWVTEKSAPHVEFTHSLCRDWENTACKAAEYGVRVALIRTGLVIGPGGFLGRLLPLFKLGLGGQLGDGSQYMPWIHRDDEINILCELLFNERAQGAYNATAPNPVTNHEFTQTLGQLLNRPTFLPAPAFMLRLLLGDMSRLLLTGQRAQPERLTHELQFTFRYPTLTAALTATLN